MWHSGSGKDTSMKLKVFNELTPRIPLSYQERGKHRVSGAGVSLLLSLVFMILPSFVVAQNSFSISGTVVDQTTGQPLPYVQVAIIHSTIGLVTNEDGLFQLLVPESNVHDTLFFYLLGYEIVKMKVDRFIDNHFIVKMNPKVIQLAEVEVIGLTPEEVIRRAVENIPMNYGKVPVILTAFIRSQKFINDRLAEFTEAIIEDLKTGYYHYPAKQLAEKHRNSNIPQLLKGRVISDTNRLNALGDVGKSAGCLGCNFINDFVEFYHNTILDGKQLKYYNLKMEELSNPSGGIIYHIRFNQKKGVKQTLWTGELFIESSSFAIIRMEQKPSFEAYNTYEKKKYRKSFTILNTPGWIEEMPLLKYTTTWSRRDTVWALNTIHIENWMTFTDPFTGEKVKTGYKNDVVITGITRDPDKIKNFKGDKSIGVNQRWDQLVGQPDDAFWTKYNYLPVETKLKEAILQIGNK
jgi:hypothetical protein